MTPVIPIMSLYVIATPIGVPTDLSERAQATILRCTHVIGEEYKNTSRFLKYCGDQNKEIYTLNEHTRANEMPDLLEIAREHEVALISDCGTPGFCDPGADLVQLCRRENIRVQSIPGVSSLMAFLSVSGHRVDQFLFRGFLPAENEKRQAAILQIKASKIAVIVMDTPYRLKKLLEELRVSLPQKQLVLGMELSTDQEKVLEGPAESIIKRLSVEKAEFVLMIL
jgi:16S rRNA (cytidine1402-2'-O)-methyltransferase